MLASVSDSSCTRCPLGTSVTRSRWVVVWFDTKCPSATICAIVAATPGAGVRPFGLGSPVAASLPPFTKKAARMFCALRYIDSSAVRSPGPSSKVSASVLAGRLVPT